MLLSLQAYERAWTLHTISAMIEAAGQPLRDLLAEGSTVESVAFSPNGRTLAASEYSGHIGLWDTAAGKRTGTLNEGNIVNSVAFRGNRGC
jgi:WD40 repeat protein